MTSQRPHIELWREACDGIREVQDYTDEEMAAYREQAWLIPPAVWLGDGRYVRTTQKSIDALVTLAADWRAADASRKARVHEAKIGQMAQRVFGEMLAANNLVLWDDDAAALTAFKQGLAERLVHASRDIDHYFPCHVVTSVDAPSFCVGPVRLMRRDDWLAHVTARAPDDTAWVDAVKETWTHDVPLPDLSARAKHDAEDVIETIGECSWIAAVNVTGNEHERSAERAKVATRLALDALGLVMRPDLARNLRGPGDSLAVTRSGELSQYAGLGMSMGTHLDIPDLLRHPPHADAFIKGTEELRTDAGWAIEAMLGIPDGMALPQLRQRWCDALYWFGAARREKTEFAALMLYGTSLDVLTNGDTADGIMDMIAAFAGGSINDPLLTDGMSIKKVVERIYNDGRSRISHGTRAALLNDLPFPLATADSVVKLALERYLIYLRRYTGDDTAKAFMAAIPALVTAQKGMPPKQASS
jgi:hypothetical protein